ncbi:GNAT family N-acetyltransferase [Candidatus Dojkabacteria bacterium]|nr:GNAT family N-acetyltransferase [Candidatus Dojkabacteria bacterium]
MKLIKVDASNVDKYGFFCRMSKMKTKGNQDKMNWLTDRFKEGLVMQLLDLKDGGRGYIEYIPGEYCWRAINADGYMVIHCLWVVGKSQNKGYGKLLIEKCIADAKQQKMKGVAMLTSEKTWLAKKGFLEKMGFESVSESDDKVFNIMVLPFDKSDKPTFSGNFEKKAAAYKDGFTVFMTHQCPYIDDAAKVVEEYARKKGLPFKTVELTSAKEVRELCPSPYGTFSIVYNGKLLSYTYLLEKDLDELVSGGR